MRASLLLISIVVLAGCGAKPYVGTAPAGKHQDISFRAVSTKLEYQSGEPIRLAGYVKNEGKRLQTVLIDADPRIGVVFRCEIKGSSGVYTPELRPAEPRAELALDNSSFMILDPEKESRVSVFDIRTVKGPDGKTGTLPPGEYQATIRYEVPPTAGEKTTDGQPVTQDGQSARYLSKSPRAVWEGIVTFKVSADAYTPPRRGPRGGGPSGG
jgi:hypothetical protein